MEAKPNCPKRHTGAERFREGKGIVAGIANSNLPEPLPEAVRQMKKALCDGSVPVRHCPAVSCFTPAVFRWTRNFNVALSKIKKQALDIESLLP